MWASWHSAVKNLPANAEDISLIPGLGRSPGGGNSNPLGYSCLKNSMDRGAWGNYSSCGCKELDTSERLSTAQHIADSHCCTAGTNTTFYSNYTPLTLLVGMQTSTATMENSVEIP